MFFMSKEPSASEPMLDVRAYHFLELRRLFSEVLGTFFLVLVAVVEKRSFRKILYDGFV